MKWIAKRSKDSYSFKIKVGESGIIQGEAYKDDYSDETRTIYSWNLTLSWIVNPLCSKPIDYLPSDEREVFIAGEGTSLEDAARRAENQLKFLILFFYDEIFEELPLCYLGNVKFESCNLEKINEKEKLINANRILINNKYEENQLLLKELQELEKSQEFTLILHN